MRLLVAIALVFASGWACTTPQTAIRRSLVSPAPRAPAQLGSRLQPGETRLHGGIAFEMEGPLPDPPQASGGDPGLMTPTLHMEGGLNMGMSEHMELGLRASYGRYLDARANVHGVLDLPALDQEDVLTLGAGLRLHMTPASSPIDISLGLGMDYTEVTLGVFLCDRCPPSGAADFDDDPDRYRMVRKDVKGLLLMDAQLQAGAHVQPWLYAFGFAGGQEAPLNVGFESDITKLDDTSISLTSEGYYGGGAEIMVGDRATLTWLAFVPLDPHPAVRRGVWQVIRFGVVFGP